MLGSKNLSQLNRHSREFLGKLITQWSHEAGNQEIRFFNAAMEIASHLNLKEIEHVYESALPTLTTTLTKPNKNMADLLEISKHLALHKQLQSSKQD
jgi:hypothetical protein